MKNILTSLIVLSFISVKAQTTQADFISLKVCIGDTTTLISTSTYSPGDTIVSFLWDLDGNGIFNDATGDTVQHYFTLGTYNVGLRIITQNGIASAVYKQVSIYTYPAADFWWENHCLGEYTMFYDISTVNPIDTIKNRLWTFGDGTYTDLTDTAKHKYPAPGIYNVTLIEVSAHECKDTTTQQVEILPLPVVGLNTPSDSVYFEGADFLLSVDPYLGVIDWSHDDTLNKVSIDTSRYNDSLHVYINDVNMLLDPEDTVFVTFTACITDPDGCTNCMSFTVGVMLIEQLQIMNLLTPNGDGYNDTWIIENIEVCNIGSVEIFNRLGDELYKSTKYNNDWDGKFEGSTLPEGAYYYILKCTSRNVYQGVVNILK